MDEDNYDITEDVRDTAETSGPVVTPLKSDDNVSIVEDIANEGNHTPDTEPYSLESLRRHDADRSKLLRWMVFLIAGIIICAVSLTFMFARNIDDVRETTNLLLTLAGTLGGGLVGHYFGKR